MRDKEEKINRQERGEVDGKAKKTITTRISRETGTVGCIERICRSTAHETLTTKTFTKNCSGPRLNRLRRLTGARGVTFGRMRFNAKSAHERAEKISRPAAQSRSHDDDGDGLLPECGEVC